MYVNSTDYVLAAFERGSVFEFDAICSTICNQLESKHL